MLAALAPLLKLIAVEGGTALLKNTLSKRGDDARANLAAKQALAQSFGRPTAQVPMAQAPVNPLDYTGLDEQLQRKLYDQIFGSLMGGGKPAAGAAAGAR